MDVLFLGIYSTEDTLIINTILLTYTKEIKKILAFFLLAQHCLEHTQKCLKIISPFEKYFAEKVHTNVEKL